MSLALITGASSGIGYEMAKKFTEEGHDLIVTGLHDRISEAADSLKFFGTDVKFIQADLAHRSGVEKLYEFVKAQGTPLDITVLNAGAGVAGDFACETNIEDEINIINLNVISTVVLAKKIVQDMVERGEGKILFTSSVVGVMPSPLQSVYAATKAFVQSFSEGIRNELQDTNITITALMPGATDTNFFDGPGLADTNVGKMKKDDPAEVAIQAYEALMAGLDHIVGGSIMNKVHVTVNKFLPESVKAILPRKYEEKVVE